MICNIEGRMTNLHFSMLGQSTIIANAKNSAYKPPYHLIFNIHYILLKRLSDLFCYRLSACPFFHCRDTRMQILGNKTQIHNYSNVLIDANYKSGRVITRSNRYLHRSAAWPHADVHS